MMLGRTWGIARANTVAIAVIVAALAFGGYIGYLEWTNSSFPVKEKPFGDYATMMATQFNGTELYFKVQWNTGDFVPLYAQITSSQTDEANSPVCDVGISPVSKGQVLDLPFAIAAPKQALASVDLALAVRAGSNSTQFTITYHLDQISAQPGKITPSTYACSQPQGSNLAVR